MFSRDKPTAAWNKQITGNNRFLGRLALIIGNSMNGDTATDRPITDREVKTAKRVCRFVGISLNLDKAKSTQMKPTE